jgi:YidC/Oxa1 family membrane protein insertase
MKQQRVKDSTKRAQDSIANSAIIHNLPLQPLAATAADSAGFCRHERHRSQVPKSIPILLRVVFTNKGGQPKTVELKKFKGPDRQQCANECVSFDQISYNIAAAQTAPTGIENLYFAPAEKTETADSTVVSYRARSAEGQEIVHRFVIKAKQLPD